MLRLKSDMGFLKEGKIILILMIIGMAMTVASCRKTDIAPAYVVITKEDISVSYDKIDLAQFNSYSGLTAHNFTDIWLTVNGEKLGTWELPCKIPVLASGKVTVSMLPGIAMNGMSTTRPEYPFVESFQQEVTLVKGEETVISPVFSYYGSSLYFPLVENFETAGTSFESSDTSAHLYVTKIYDDDLIYKNPTDPSDKNTCSGWVELAEHSDFEIVSPVVKLPGAGKSVFLELNYKCDQDLYIGLVAIQSTSVPTHEALVGLRATGGAWKKAYVNLTLAVSRNTTATGFRVVLSGAKNGSAVANYYFDNIRVMYLY